MATLDPTFEARRRAVLGNNYAPSITSSTKNRIDPTFEARRQQVFANPTIQQPQVSQPQQKQQSSAQKFIAQAKPVAKGVFQNITGFIKSIPEKIKEVKKDFKKEPEAFTVGASVAGTKLISEVGNVEGKIVNGIASIIGKKIPERWDLSLQAKAFKELNKMNVEPYKGNKAFQVGEVYGNIVKFAFEWEIARGTVGKVINLAGARIFAPKIAFLAPKIATIATGAGLGQLEYDKETDGTRVNRLKSDVITFGLFETIPILAKGVSKVTGKLISTAYNKVAGTLKNGKSVEIASLEKITQPVNEAIVQDTGKNAQSLLVNNVAKTSEKELKLLSTPKPTKQLGAPKEKFVTGEGFEMTEKASPQKIVIGKSINAFEEAKAKFNKNPTVRNRTILQNARTEMNKLKNQGLVQPTKPVIKPSRPIETKPQGVEVKVEAKPKPIEIKPKEVAVPREQLPVGEGETPSKIGVSIERKAIEKKLTEGFEGIAGYDKITIKEQAAKATDTMANFEEARAIIRGEKPLPKGLRGTALITAAEERIAKTGDAKLAYELANSPLVSETSAAAQELRLAAERVPDSLVLKLREIKQIREEVFKKRFGGKTIEEIKNRYKQKVKIPPPKLNDWGAIIREVRC